MSDSKDLEFPLAKLKTYRSDLLLVNDADEDVVRKAKELTLILALGFNMLKDLQIAYERIATLPKDPQPVTARNGQINGMGGNYTRLMTGVFFELSLAIRERSAVRRWKPWHKCEWALPPVARDAWDKVTSLATGKGNQRKVQDYLHDVRNQVTYHFDGDALADGYKRFFVDDVSLDGGDALYSSEGDSMDGTRFYFADAAAQAAEQKHLREKQIEWGKVAPIAIQFNEAIRRIVPAMLAVFAKQQHIKPRRKR